MVMMMNNKRLARLGCAALLSGIMIISAACGASEPVKKADAQQKEEQGDFIEAAGKVTAGEIRNITLEFPAIVEDVLVEEGEHVKLGQELMSLDIHEIKQQITSMENSLKSERLQLEKLISSDTNNSMRESSALSTAQENLSRANEDLQKKQALYEAGAIPRNEFTDAQRRVADAQRAVSDASISSSNDYKLSIEMQNQRISTLESDLNQLRSKLSKSYMQGSMIVSEFQNGMVQDITPVAGDTAQSSSRLLNLVNMDTLVVEAEVLEDFIKDVKPGAKADILPISDSGKQYKGTVTKIADMGVEKNGETVVTVQISIDDADKQIKPGFNVDVRIVK